MAWLLKIALVILALLVARLLYVTIVHRDRLWLKSCAAAAGLVVLVSGAIWTFLVEPSIRRHDAQTAELKRELVALVDAQLPEPRIVSARRNVDNRASAGGYCSYYVTLYVRTTASATRAQSLLRAATAKRPQRTYTSACEADLKA